MIIFRYFYLFRHMPPPTGSFNPTSLPPSLPLSISISVVSLAIEATRLRLKTINLTVPYLKWPKKSFIKVVGPHSKKKDPYSRDFFILCIVLSWSQQAQFQKARAFLRLLDIQEAQFLSGTTIPQATNTIADRKHYSTSMSTVHQTQSLIRSTI